MNINNGNLLTPVLIRSPGGRSGTSLMMELLSSSSEIAFDRRHPYEVRMLSYFYRQSEAMYATKEPGWANDLLVRGKLNSIGPIPVKTELINDSSIFINNHFLSSWSTFSSEVMNNHTCGNGLLPKYYAEKIPHDILPAVSNIMRCKKIFLVRDPRAEFSSILSFNEKRKSNLFGWQVDDTASSFCSRFVSARVRYFQMLDDIVEDESNMIVRYEDMVLSPIEVCKKLSQFLNVDITNVEVKKNITQNSVHMTSMDPASSITKWKRHLPDDIVTYINSNLVLSNNLYSI
ncbi:sulfotransferase domain-containing protein [Vibrio sp. FNV 38]|nr:sulfotransferase domain-containing protein [Vibrio sp. FNV 38]